MTSLHLVRVIREDSAGTVQSKLENAFVVLADAYCKHLARHNSVTCDVRSGWREVARSIRNLDQPIDLTEAHRVCADITDRSERPVEVFNALGHMEVLLAALDLLSAAHPQLNSNACAPTQQYTDSDENVPSLDGATNFGKPRIADLEGPGFVLEAYGGVNYRNNSKVALDFDLLRRIQIDKPGVRCFVCVRQEAIKGKARELPNWKHDDFAKATCAKRHGGPWNIQSQIVGRWPLNGSSSYVLLELSNFSGCPKE